MAQEPAAGRHSLPIQNPPHRGLITYDVKDPATKFAPIEPLPAWSKIGCHVEP